MMMGRLLLWANNNSGGIIPMKSIPAQGKLSA